MTWLILLSKLVGMVCLEQYELADSVLKLNLLVPTTVVEIGMTFFYIAHIWEEMLLSEDVEQSRMDYLCCFCILFEPWMLHLLNVLQKYPCVTRKGATIVELYEAE